MKQQSEIEIKALALAKREATLQVQEAKIEHEKQNLIRIEQAARTKEKSLSKKEQNLIMEAKHLHMIQQEILKREEQRETNSPMPHQLHCKKSYTQNSLSVASGTRLSTVSSSHPHLPTKQNSPTSRTAFSPNPHLNHDMSDMSDCSNSLSTNSPRYRRRKNLGAKSRCHDHSYSQGSFEHTCSLQLLENRALKANTPTQSHQGNSSVTSSSKKKCKKRQHEIICGPPSAKGSTKRMNRESPDGRIYKRTPKKVFLGLDDD